MSNAMDDNRSASGMARADGAQDRNAVLMRLVAEGLQVDDGELQSWRSRVEELYRSAASQAARPT